MSNFCLVLDSGPPSGSTHMTHSIVIQEGLFFPLSCYSLVIRSSSFFFSPPTFCTRSTFLRIPSPDNWILPPPSATCDLVRRFLIIGPIALFLLLLGTTGLLIVFHNDCHLFLFSLHFSLSLSFFLLLEEWSPNPQPCLVQMNRSFIHYQILFFFFSRQGPVVDR